MNSFVESVDFFKGNNPEDIAKEYGAIPQFEINITESNDGDICAKQLRLTEEQLQVVLRDNNLALYVGKEAPNYGGMKRDLSLCSCGAGGTGFCMSPKGDLRACVAFPQTFGNLREQTVEEILTKRNHSSMFFATQAVFTSIVGALSSALL